MTIRYKCDGCGVTMKIKEDLAGKKGKCPQCKNRFIIPQPGLPEDEVVEEEEFEDEPEDEEEDDDDLLDMPMELTASPVTAPEPEVSRPRERKAASETKKPTRIRTAAQKAQAPKKKKLDDGEFDPTDVLFGDDDGPEEAAKPERPRGRVLGLDEEDDAPVPRGSRASMQDMFKDFTPAGGGAKKRTAEIDSTSAAAQALARQAEEKRAKASEPEPIQDVEEGPDYVGAVKDLLSQYGLIVGVGALLILGLGYGMNSMLSQKSDIPPLNEVYGTLTKGGDPIDGADIFFTPEASEIKVNNSGASVITKPDGTYEVEYLPGSWGLPAGKYRVEVKSNGGMIGVKKVTIQADMDNQLDLKF